MSVGDKIMRLRLERGMTLEEFGKFLVLVKVMF